MRHKNKRFETPMIEVILLNHEDILTTSGDPNELPGVDPFAFLEG